MTEKFTARQENILSWSMTGGNRMVFRKNSIQPMVTLRVRMMVRIILMVDHRAGLRRILSERDPLKQIERRQKKEDTGDE